MLIISAANPTAAYVVKVMFVYLSVGATTVIFFYPKFAIIHGFWSTETSSTLKLAQNPQPKKRAGSYDDKLQQSTHIANFAESYAEGSTPKDKPSKHTSWLPNVGSFTFSRYNDGSGEKIGEVQDNSSDKLSRDLDQQTQTMFFGGNENASHSQI